MTFRQSTAAAALSDGECSDDDDNNRDDDDNGPSPRQRPRLQPSSASANAAATTSGDASSKKFSVWTDMVIDQDLSDKLDSGVAVRRDQNRVNRGAESYDAPPPSSRRFRLPPGMRPHRPTTTTRVSSEQLAINIEPTSMDTDKDDDGPSIWTDTNSNDAPSAPPPPSPVDDIFANVFDASPIAEIGVKGESSSSHRSSSVTLDIPTFTSSKSNKQHAYAGGKRDRGRGGGGRGAKRPFINRNDHYEKRPAVDKQYSLQRLQTITFADELSLDDMGKIMAKALGELKPDMIVNAVELLGRETACKLFNQTRDIEGSGGLMVVDKSRRRTPGGVFLFLLRSDANISQDIKDKVFGGQLNDNSASGRKHKKAVRRSTTQQQPVSFDETLLETRLAVQQRRQQQQEQERQPLSLSNSTDVMLASGIDVDDGSTSV